MGPGDTTLYFSPPFRTAKSHTPVTRRTTRTQMCCAAPTKVRQTIWTDPCAHMCWISLGYYWLSFSAAPLHRKLMTTLTTDKLRAVFYGSFRCAKVKWVTNSDSRTQ